MTAALKRYELRYSVLAVSQVAAMSAARDGWDGLHNGESARVEGVIVFEERTEPKLEQIGSIGVSRVG